MNGVKDLNGFLRDMHYASELYDHLNKITSEDEYSLLSFRKVNKYLLDNLENSQITVSNPRVFNDPFDCPIFKWIPLKLKGLSEKEDLNILKSWNKSFESIKICCFSNEYNTKTKKRNIENPLMWAHYANMHKGVCIKYKLKNTDFEQDDLRFTISRLGRVRYKKKLPLKNMNSMKLSKALLYKQKDWKYEDECRLIHYSFGDTLDRKNIGIPLSSIQAIYFGLKCRKQDINKILNILRTKSIDVPLYRMIESTENIYSLNDEKYVK